MRRVLVALVTAALLLGSGAAAHGEAEPQMDLEPSWTTNDRLLRDGVLVRASGLGAFNVVHLRAVDTGGGGAAFEDDTLEMSADDTLEHLLRPGSAFPVGPQRVWFQSAEDGSVLVETTIVVTELSVRAPRNSITGAGFQPGSTVKLTVDQTAAGTATANASGDVTFPSRWAGSHRVTLRSTAGEVSRDLVLTSRPDAGFPDVPRPDLPRFDEVLKVVEDSVALARALDRQLDLQKEMLAGKALPAQQLSEGPVFPGASLSFGLAGDDLASIMDQVQRERIRILEEQLASFDERPPSGDEAVDWVRRQALVNKLNEARDALAGVNGRVQEGRATVLGIMRSAPQVLGTVPVRTDGTLRLQIPRDAEPGQHHVALVDPQSGLILVYVPVSVSAPGATAPASQVLPAVGAGAVTGIFPLGVLALLAGAAMLTGSAPARSRP